MHIRGRLQGFYANIAKQNSLIPMGLVLDCLSSFPEPPPHLELGLFVSLVTEIKKIRMNRILSTL